MKRIHPLPLSSILRLDRRCCVCRCIEFVQQHGRRLTDAELAGDDIDDQVRPVFAEEVILSCDPH